MRILLAIIINACALGAAAFLLNGIEITGTSEDAGAVVLAHLVVGLVFGIVNVVIKPIVSLVALPITCLTLGLFGLVINAAMLMLTEWLTSFTSPFQLHITEFFWDAIFGAIIVSLVSALLNRFLVVPATQGG